MIEEKKLKKNKNVAKKQETFLQQHNAWQELPMGEVRSVKSCNGLVVEEKSFVFRSYDPSEVTLGIMNLINLDFERDKIVDRIEIKDKKKRKGVGQGNELD